MTATDTPSPGHLLARDGEFYPITEIRESLDGPLVVADAPREGMIPARLILKAADLRAAGQAGETTIWRT